jgi:hypothetical protein
MTCPNCLGAMITMSLAGHQGTRVQIDLCTGCHGIWFDRLESLRLAPDGTLRLFTLIGEQTRSRTPLGSALKCPRCPTTLLRTHDRQRNTSFQYWRCGADHGRFITFFEFLREKNFIKPLSADQVAELRRNVQSVNCSNCGGPVDLAKGAVCDHCGSPLSLLDMRQTSQVVAELKRAAEPRAIDPTLPIELARARREVDLAFATIEPNADWWRDASATGLVEAGLAVFSRWMRKS